MGGEGRGRGGVRGREGRGRGGRRGGEGKGEGEELHVEDSSNTISWLQFGSVQCVCVCVCVCVSDLGHEVISGNVHISSGNAKIAKKSTPLFQQKVPKEGEHRSNR